MADLERVLSAQAAVLGDCLIENDLMPQLVSQLTAEDFDGSNRVIYAAIAAALRDAADQKPADTIAVAERLRTDGIPQQYIINLMENTPTAANFDGHVQLVRELSRLRKLNDMGRELSEAPSLETAEERAEQVAQLLIGRPGMAAHTADSLLASFYRRHTESVPSIPLGLPALDSGAVHVRKGQFVIIGAEPSGGKTAFALQAMWAMARTYRTLFISLETDADILFDRLAANVAEIPMDRLIDGKLNDEDWERQTEQSIAFASRDFRVLAGAGMTVEGIRAAVMAYQAEVVIVDYLQIIQSAAPSRYEKVTEISMGLHILAQSLGVCVIALSQVTNRDPSAKNQPLGLHSGRESGQIEADADIMMMIDRFVEPELKKSGCKANRILRVCKNKNGRLCNVPLSFDGKFQRFRQAAVPNPDWARLREKPKPKPEPELEQLPMETAVPFGGEKT